MKKIVMLATATLLFSGISFAQDSKQTDKGKKSCKKGGACCKDKKNTTAKL